jgi:hypothetical protein
VRAQTKRAQVEVRTPTSFPDCMISNTRTVAPRSPHSHPTQVILRRSQAEDEEREEKDTFGRSGALHFEVKDIHAILTPAATQSQEGRSRFSSGFDEKPAGERLRAHVQKSHKLFCQVEEEEGPPAGDADTKGHRALPPPGADAAPKVSKKKKARGPSRDVQGPTEPDSAQGVTAGPLSGVQHGRLTYKSAEGALTADQWLEALKSSSAPPNREQLKVLEAVIRRCNIEAEQERADDINPAGDEPLRMLLHGLPGTGKSRVILWLRQLFEDIFGWVHSAEFQCLASFNTMAALIKGNTIHSWGEVYIDKKQATAKQFAAWANPDVSTMWGKIQHMRFIIIDEIESVSTELLATLDTEAQETIHRGHDSLHVSTHQPSSGPCSSPESNMCSPFPAS